VCCPDGPAQQLERDEGVLCDLGVGFRHLVPGHSLHKAP